MENEIINRKISTFHKIFDGYPSDKQDTKIFSNRDLTHEKISDAFEYWINSFKKQIQDDYTVDNFHTMQDSGIDILIKFELIDLRIGIQIKSYGDIKEKKFYKNTLAQIQESHSHNPKLLVLVLCGDKNDKSQLHKMRHLKSKISQQMTDYVKILEPETALTIYKVFFNGENPLDLLRSSIDLGEGVVGVRLLGEALHERHRDVDRRDLGAGMGRHQRHQPEMVDVLVGEDDQPDVLERVPEAVDPPGELVERGAGVGSGIHEREGVIVDQIYVHPAYRERRRNRQAVHPFGRRRGEGIFRHARISASTSSRFSSMCSRERSDSRLRRSSGSVLEDRTLKCQSS